MRHVLFAGRGALLEKVVLVAGLPTYRSALPAVQLIQFTVGVDKGNKVVVNAVIKTGSIRLALLKSNKKNYKHKVNF